MAVVLKFQSTGAIPGQGDPIAMRGPSLTIGRGQENDVVLPDPDRVLSKRHCAIEDHNGNVVVVDISTNGTFLNYGKLPLGAAPTPINNGDILSIGPYEMLVQISSETRNDLIADPVPDGPVSHGNAAASQATDDLLDNLGSDGDFLDDLLSGRDAPVGPRGVSRDEPDDDGLLPPLDEDDLLGPGEDPYAGQGASMGIHNQASQDHFQVPRTASGGQTIPDDWDDDLLGPGNGNHDDPFAHSPVPDTGSALSPIPLGKPPEGPVAASRPNVRPDDVPEPQRAPVQSGPSANGPQSDAAARAFLAALGAEDVDIPDTDLTPTLSRLGHVLRTMIVGLREVLMTRTSIKSEFRIEQTMIQSGGNNPLKFSISPEQAIEAMVKTRAKGYLDPTDAAEQALRDIKAHEVAMITGMEAALKGVLARLDPATLEQKITAAGGLGGLLKSKKARYWEIYEDMYAEISDQAENDFHDLFAKEFARAYKEQLDRLK